MINDSLIDPYVINAGAHNGNRLPDDYDYDPCRSTWSNSICIFFDFTILICIFGVLGNGMLIRLLGFHIKKSPFTIFILNLAIADFGVLIATIMSRLYYFSVHSYILAGLSAYTFLCMFSTSQMFLTVISVDRCVSVFFPLWHQSHRRTWLSTLVCALAWLLSFLTAATHHISRRTYRTYFISNVAIYLFVANGFICIRLMTISSLMLFINVCCKSRQPRRQKLLTTILVTVAFSLLCCLLVNTLMLMFFLNEAGEIFMFGPMSCACLNSSINPLIYYLVGRRKGEPNKSMKSILQNLFKEETI